ncbi:sporulation integral membrane protein YtvI [Dehalobacterium formicoaceticum]|uniref:Sporulation integral membrane protein YtvI n=1 Tax=Dehalobacterium formicoaceticum TaxID=51515 RepID=A0ABT1Y461_9FIRM|nr:sporulation integral membrane protein YtvI [Dehalobacterium formicoaceticum]MCR6544704.1 sporulation integral membrane protein YtvI [Dehalobacterium formicoaceticum]
MERFIKAGTLALVAISLYLLYYHIFPAAGAIIGYVLPALAPFIFALVVAVLIDPLVSWMTKRLKVPRGLAVLAMLLAFFALVSGILMLLISKLITELHRFSQNLPELNQLFTNLFNDFLYYYNNMDLSPEVMSQIQQGLSNATQTLTSFVYSAINGIVGFAAALPSFLIMLVITIIATFFISRDKLMVEKFFLSILPKKWQGSVESVYLDMTSSLVRYLGAIVVLVSITALISIIGLSILGVDYAFSMGVLIGFVDILPVLGPGLVFVTWIILSLIMGNFKFAFSLLILYIIITVNRQIMEPKLVATTINVHPLSTLAAIFIGLKLLGPWGVILGPITLVAGKSISKLRKK